MMGCDVNGKLKAHQFGRNGGSVANNTRKNRDEFRDVFLLAAFLVTQPQVQPSVFSKTRGRHFGYLTRTVFRLHTLRP